MHTKWLFLVSLFLLTSARTGAEDAPPRIKIQPRVYGGQEISNAGLGGFGVQIFYLNRLVCTGTLLSPRHLITAAHCFENMPQANFHVVGGRTREFDHGARKNRLVEVRLHPSFQKTKFIGDIAVAKTQYPLKGRSIGYAKICSVPLFSVDTVTVAGWGTTEARSAPGTPSTLRMIRVPIVEHKACEEKLGRTMPPNILCASGYDHKTLCSGDSGGPLVFRNEVCGVNTWTYLCGDNEKPDVFMSVRYYAKFIKSTMKEMGN